MRTSDHVVEHNGYYYVATWSERNAQYTGPLRADLAKSTGCSGFFCRSEKGLPGAGGYRYKTRASAMRRVRAIFVEE